MSRTKEIDFFFQANRGEVFVEVEAEFSPADPEVGIMSSGYDMSFYKVTDSDGNSVVLNDVEEKRLLAVIEGKLAQAVVDDEQDEDL